VLGNHKLNTNIVIMQYIRPSNIRISNLCMLLDLGTPSFLFAICHSVKSAKVLLKRIKLVNKWHTERNSFLQFTQINY